VHPSQQDFGRTRVGNGPLPETAFDFLVTRGLAVSTRGALAALVTRERLIARGGAPLAYRPSSDKATPSSSRRRRTMRACSPGSMEQSRISPACMRSSCSTERASKASSSGASGGGLCIQRNRISAAGGSVTARSRRPRSISASLGGAETTCCAAPVPAPRARPGGEPSTSGHRRRRQLQRAGDDGLRPNGTHVPG
jgi:hypothetical protein